MLSKLARDGIRARHVDDETLHKPRMYVPEYARPSEGCHGGNANREHGPH
jgi:hypothetical protein